MPLAEINATTLLVIAVVGIAVLGVAYFAVRFWLISTRPANIQDVKTPNIDRMNQQALEALGDEEEEEDEEAPEDLKKIVPEEEKGK